MNTVSCLAQLMSRIGSEFLYDALQIYSPMAVKVALRNRSMTVTFWLTAQIHMMSQNAKIKKKNKKVYLGVKEVVCQSALTQHSASEITY